MEFVSTGNLMRSLRPVKCVRLHEPTAPIGSFQLLEIYPTEEALDYAKALASIPHTYSEMWDSALGVEIEVDRRNR